MNIIMDVNKTNNIILKYVIKNVFFRLYIIINLTSLKCFYNNIVKPSLTKCLIERFFVIFAKTFVNMGDNYEQ